MTNNKFTVIKGGIDVSPDMSSRKFISAFITDTRLMGVVGMYIHWELTAYEIPQDFHQFFYFDAEEYGFENYLFVRGNNACEIHKIDSMLMGGLGGKKIDINEQECRYLAQKFAAINKRLSLSMPSGYSDYAFLLEPLANLSKIEETSLWNKMCTNLTTKYTAINYFLMRLFGKDGEAAAHLVSAKAAVNLSIYSEIEAATLCKNTIDTVETSESMSYLCESIIECDETYMLVVSEITLDDDLKITSIVNHNSFKISTAEAAMSLSRAEFMTVYSTLFPAEAFETESCGLTDGAMSTPHENGTLYMVFNKNNNHVDLPVFRLNEDVSGLYYMSNNNQLIVASYSLEGIHQLEKTIRLSPIKDLVVPVAKYEFKEPVLYEFIQSDFDDFNEFLIFIKDE